VPNLIDLKNVLSQERKTAAGTIAIDPVFILDQTFCPNVHFFGRRIFLLPLEQFHLLVGQNSSGGQCTAGYCVGNKKRVL
jgi:hypothetical protein